MYENAIG